MPNALKRERRHAGVFGLQVMSQFEIPSPDWTAVCFRARSDAVASSDRCR